MTDDELTAHKHRLIVRSATLRMAWREQVQAIKRPLVVVEQAQSGMQWLVRNPQWVVGGAVLLGVLRPRRVLAWAGRLWWGWNLYTRTRQLLAANP
ncbi:MAG: hypothetical protein RLZZ573_1283 [Pseudomonadota bacterium]